MKYTQTRTQADTLALALPLCTQKPHSSSVHLIKPQDLGNKTVNPLLSVRVARQGWLHIMQDERRVALSLKLASWSPALSASQTPSYSMPVEHWFSTLLAHMIPPFLRGKLPGWKKKGLPVIDWSTALLNSGYKLREMRREGGGRVRMKTVHSGAFAC